MYEAYAQAEANSGDHEPILFMKKNRKKALAVVDAEWFIKNVSSSN